jgi:tRNA (cytidine/uridine-2'-O-)-methyltransferase
MMNIVLVEPEIPQNTGNIARTCAASGTGLILVRPLGFSIEDRYLKRAGLDYWDKLNVKYFDSFNEVSNEFPSGTFYYATTKGGIAYTEVGYTDDCFLVFGKETSGLPQELLDNNIDKCIRIPVRDNIRSLNLSNAVAIVLYEALRQKGFAGLEKYGRMYEKGKE